MQVMGNSRRFNWKYSDAVDSVGWAWAIGEETADEERPGCRPGSHLMVLIWIAGPETISLKLGVSDVISPAETDKVPFVLYTRYEDCQRGWDYVPWLVTAAPATSAPLTRILEVL